jgi:CRISPR-associated protein Csy3
MTQIKKLPSVLAFTRAHFITDAAFYSRMPDGTEKPVLVELQGIKGTQNVSDSNGNGESKNNIVNLQRVESAKVDVKAQALIIKFSLGFLDISKTLHSCNGKDMAEVMAFRKSLKDFLFRAKNSGAIEIIAKRYARNVLNGRWLWRNKDIAKQILINVNYNDTELIKDYDVSKSSLSDFENFNESEEKLANLFAKQLKGEDLNAVEVTAVLIPKAKGSFEVYPSQNYQEVSKNEEFPVRKILFKINNQNQAGLRDQKVFNAIKTIDDWYQHDYKEEIGPIPVEAFGSNITWNLFLRGDRKDKNNAFDILKILNSYNDNNEMLAENALFILSIIERGGIFSESDSKDKAKKEAVVKENDDSEEA